MTEVMPVQAEAPEVVSNPMEIRVTTNYSAPDEQQSSEKPVEETHVEAEVKPEEPAKESEESIAARRAIEAEIRAEKAERELKSLKPAPKELGERPKIENFDTLENYEKAVDEWHEAKAEKTFQERTSSQEKAAQEHRFKTAVLQKEQASRAKHTDYDAVVGNIVPIVAPVINNNPFIRDFVANNPMSTEVLYELGKNPVILQQMLGANLSEAGEMLINMAARLKAPKAAPLSNAPEPIKPVGSREVAKTKLSDLSTSEYIRKMNKMELGRRRTH